MAWTSSIYMPIAGCFPFQLKRLYLKLDCFLVHLLKVMVGWMDEWVIGLIACLTDWLSLTCRYHTVKMKYWFQKHYMMYEYIFTVIFFINSVSTLTFSRSHTNHGASRSSTAVVRLVPGTDLCLYGWQLWSVHWLLSMNCLTILCLTCRGLVRAFNLWLVHGMAQWRLLSSLRKS